MFWMEGNRQSQVNLETLNIPYLQCFVPLPDSRAAVRPPMAPENENSDCILLGRFPCTGNRMRSVIPGVNFPHLDPCWLATPAEDSVTFLDSFVRMSMAIQAALRETVPMEYFASVDRFREIKTAAPMLVYQASPPFRGKKRSELTYDVLNPALLAMLFRRSKPKLIDLLTNVEQRLRAEGHHDLATQYSPNRAASILHDVQRLAKSRRYLALLIRGESVLVDALVHLSGIGKLPPRGQIRRWVTFGKRWNYQLRRLYPGCNCMKLASALLAAAAAVMHSAPDQLDSGGLGPSGLSSEMLQTADGELPEIS